MDFSFTILENVATLRDPCFAFGFFTAVTVLVASAFTAAWWWGHADRRRRRVSRIASFIAILATLATRGMIGVFANVAVALTSGGNVSVHFWFMRPYVLAAWGAGFLALLVAISMRSMQLRRTRHRNMARP